MFRIVIIFSILLVSVPAFADLKVVASTPDLAAIAKAIGGNNVGVGVLSSHLEDPHFVDARPDKILLLNKADLLIEVGLGLESGWLPALMKQARNSKILSGNGLLVASNFVALRDKTNVDRASGDVHNGGNPHFTYDPREGIKIAYAIRDRLVQLEPSSAPAFKENTTKLVTALKRIVKKEQTRFAMLPETSRKVVSYHKSLPYLLDWLKLSPVIELEPKPGVPPNPRHMSKVVQQIKKNGVRVIIQEKFYPQSTSKTIAKITKIKVVALDGGTQFPQQTYLQRVQNTANKIYEAINE